MLGKADTLNLLHMITTTANKTKAFQRRNTKRINQWQEDRCVSPVRRPPRNS
jgi:c-di-GMP-binding flagellar brake protein YcgR